MRRKGEGGGERVRNKATLKSQMFKCNQKRRRKNTLHTKNYMVLMFRI